MKNYIAATVLLFTALMAHAQTDSYTSSTYNRAIGIKFPAGVAITYKTIYNQ